MKGSFTATMSMSWCSTLPPLSACCDVAGQGLHSRIAEDDAANATEAVDTDLAIVSFSHSQSDPYILRQRLVGLP